MTKQLSTGLILAAAMLLGGCGNAANTGVANTNTASANANRSMANSPATSTANTANSATNTAANTAATTTAPSPDEFMKKAAQGGMAEVELGKLAGQKGQNAEVKSYGQMMVSDHGKANAELKTLAEKKNVTLPADLGNHASTHEKLKGLTGAEFDRSYVEAMVADHEATVNDFQKQADSSTDADVKAFATKTLPTLKAHLEKIRGIQAKLK